MNRSIRLLVDGLAGAVCASALPLAVVAVGWTQALTRRAVWRRLHRETAAVSPFVDFAETAALTREAARPPRWIAHREHREGATRWTLCLPQRLAEGFASVSTLGILSVPAGALWLAGWHIGWNHSFYKSYELASVGPLVSATGVVAFVAAMLYAPVAQTHQAVARKAGAFFHFSEVRAVLAGNPLGCAQLAAWHALISLPVVVLKTAPMVFDRFEGAALLDEAAVAAQLQRYYFWAGAAVFAGYVFLRTRAAKTYARGLRVAIERNPSFLDARAPELAASLRRLGIPKVTVSSEGWAPPALLAGVRVAWRGVATVAAMLLWLSVAAQIFVTEFLNYHGPQGWLNQPLLQLPWFHYLPPGLG